MSRTVCEISQDFADVVAECEHWRTHEPYPQPLWRAAWDRRIALQSEWMAVAGAMKPTWRPPA